MKNPFSKNGKSKGLPNYDNPPAPPPGFKPGGYTPEYDNPPAPTQKTGANQPTVDKTTSPPKSNVISIADLYPGFPSLSSGLKLFWQFETFDSNTEARDFLNERNIEPFAIYPTSTGKITVWHSKIVKA